jgi:outer membrane lipopolysaccharide assembly protein LptE/RlpB
VRRCWSDTGFDDASLLDQTSTEMEKLALSSHHKRAKSEKDAKRSSDENAMEIVSSSASAPSDIPDMEDISMDTSPKCTDDDDMSEEEDSMVIRVRDPYRALILRNPVDSPLERLLRRELEQNSMALVVYEDPKKNLTLGPLLTLLEDQRAKLGTAIPDVEMQDAPSSHHSFTSSSEMEL